MSSPPTPAPPEASGRRGAAPGRPANSTDRFAIRCEVLRLSAQPSAAVLLFQFLLDCGVAGLFAWRYSVPHALAWIALIAATTAWRGFFPQRLPTPLTPDNLQPALREHTLRIALHEGAHGLAGV